MAAVPQTKGLNCPNCGAALTLRGFAHTLSIVCAQCLSVLDAQDPNLRLLQQFQEAQRVQPIIPLGSRGKLDGVVYEVIGFQVRTIQVEGVSYSWHEYLLFNPYQGFRYLTQYEGHWNFVRNVSALPENTSGGTRFRSKFAVALGGVKYAHFQTAEAETTFVMGEFPWQVRVGEKARTSDFVSPPFLLSSEGYSFETTWSLGRYITGADVWRAFRLPGNPPPAKGVFANQPNPLEERSKNMWRLFRYLVLIVVILTFIVHTMARRDQVFRQSYSYSTTARGEASFVTDVFNLEGRTSGVEISISTNLKNEWAYFNMALINQETGHAWEFGREVSYYSGTDSDGSWSEGGPTDTVTLSSIPSGRYYLRVEPEMETGPGGVFSTPKSVNYEIRVRRDVPVTWPFFLAAGFLLVPPVIATIRKFTFESARWQESDYAVSSSGGDDSSGDDE